MVCLISVCGHEFESRLTASNENIWLEFYQINKVPYPKKASPCCSVGEDFVYHTCGHELKSRLKWKFSNFPHHLWLLLCDYRGIAKWFGAQHNQEVHFSWAVKCKKGPQALTTDHSHDRWSPYQLNHTCYIAPRIPVYNKIGPCYVKW